MKINSKIVGYKVKQPIEEPKMHEGLKRPEALNGTTYKVSPPDGPALYVTINDYVLDTQRVPFEIFINSKNMEHFQWIIALTMVISAVFRKGGEVEFLAEELKNVFDPKGGYFKKGEGFVPSIVADIGSVIAKHLGEIKCEL